MIFWKAHRNAQSLSYRSAGKGRPPCHTEYTQMCEKIEPQYGGPLDRAEICYQCHDKVALRTFKEYCNSTGRKYQRNKSSCVESKDATQLIKKYENQLQTRRAEQTERLRKEEEFVNGMPGATSAEKRRSAIRFMQRIRDFAQYLRYDQDKYNSQYETFKARALQQYRSNESKIEDDDEKWLAHSPDIAPVWLAEKRLQAIHDLHVNKQIQGFDYNASTGHYDLKKKTKPDVRKNAQARRKHTERLLENAQARRKHTERLLENAQARRKHTLRLFETSKLRLTDSVDMWTKMFNQ